MSRTRDGAGGASSDEDDDDDFDVRIDANDANDADSVGERTAARRDEEHRRRTRDNDDHRSVLGYAVFRLLCTETRVGGLIGKSGANVKRIVADTGATVKVLDSATRCSERAVLIAAPRSRKSRDARGENDDDVDDDDDDDVDTDREGGKKRRGEAKENAKDDECPAKMAAMIVAKFLTSHRRMGGSEDSEEEERVEDSMPTESETPKTPNMPEESELANDAESPNVTLRVLVPAGQAGHLIGKGGENIRDIRRKANGAHVAVQEVGQVPACATSEDRVVEIHGKAPDVCDAAELIFELLREFLVDSSVLGYYQPALAAPRSDPYASAVNLATADPAIVGIAPQMVVPVPMQAPMQVPMQVAMQVPVPMQVPMQMQVPMSPQMYMMQAPPLVSDSVEVEGEDVQNVLGVQGSNISTIARISGCQVSMIETDPETNTSEVELKGPHESNIAAAKSLVKAFAAGQQPVEVVTAMPTPPMGFPMQPGGGVYHTPPMYAMPEGP